MELLKDSIDTQQGKNKQETFMQASATSSILTLYVCIQGALNIEESYGRDNLRVSESVTE